MILTDLLQETFSALTANKSRSGLTILGIVIGIGSVIAMISIGQGAQNSIKSSIESLGSNLLSVTPGFSQRSSGTVSQGRGSAQTLKVEDAEALLGLDGVLFVSPESSRRFQIISSSGLNTNSTIMGVVPDYLSVRNLSVSSGSFISSSQQQSMGRVAVLGPTLAQDLFGEGSDPLGKTIRINNVIFKVIGVTQAKGGSGFSNPDDMAFVPLSTMQKILSGNDFISSISLSVSDRSLMTNVKQAVIEKLAQRHGVAPENPDFSVMSQEDITSAFSQVTQTFTIFLASVAGISLVVGGIGIMNMMLTTVTERTREIGLRKAIGAKRKDINLQFLAEAVVLTFLGGFLGVIFGWLVSLLIAKFASVSTSVSASAILMAFGVSAVIGIVFGYYPARRAASLNPIEALRYE